jgi:hypothetical protein
MYLQLSSWKFEARALDFRVQRDFPLAIYIIRKWRCTSVCDRVHLTISHKFQKGLHVASLTLLTTRRHFIRAIKSQKVRKQYVMRSCCMKADCAARYSTKKIRASRSNPGSPIEDQSGELHGFQLLTWIYNPHAPARRNTCGSVYWRFSLRAEQVRPAYSSQL